MSDARTAAVPVDVQTLSLGPIGTNCFIANVAGDRRAVIVDPGAQGDRVIAAVRARDLTVEAVLITHCHWDHIGAVAPVARELGVPVYMSRIEAPVLEDIGSYAPEQFGPYESWKADELLDGGERLELAGMQLEVIHLPGHSPGTMGFYAEGVAGDDGGAFQSPPVLFVGDLIFQGSIGRSDLPFADGDVLLESAAMLLERLDDATVLYPGHGPDTTIGRERQHNPFLRGLGSRGA